MNDIQEIKIGKITAKALDIDGAKVLDVRRRGGGIIFVGFVDAGKWPFLKMVLERLETAMTKAGWL